LPSAIRAEIGPKKLSALYSALAEIGVKLVEKSLPDMQTLEEEAEYSLSVQITSFSDVTDRSVNIPNVPG